MAKITLCKEKLANYLTQLKINIDAAKQDKSVYDNDKELWSPMDYGSYGKLEGLVEAWEDNIKMLEDLANDCH